jgi:hypothetical protein
MCRSREIANRTSCKIARPFDHSDHWTDLNAFALQSFEDLRCKINPLLLSPKKDGELAC